MSNVPSKTYIAGVGFYRHEAISESYVAYLEELLKEAHDIIDDKNAQMEASDGTLICCGNTGEYDEHGLIHEDDCILVKIRHVIHT